MPVKPGSTWAEYTWKELADALQALLEERPGRAKAGELDPARLAHELQVHQVELEMQNRELREARGALEATSSRYADLFHNAPVGYAVLDSKGVILEINFAASSMLHALRDLLVGLPFVAAARLTEKTAFNDLLRGAARKAQTQTADLETRAAGASSVMQVTLKPDLGPNRERLGFLVTMIDISDRRRAEQERAALEGERRAHAASEAANRTKDQFLGIVSHELRTPLNAILGWAHVLVDRQTEDALIAGSRRYGATGWP